MEGNRAAEPLLIIIPAYNEENTICSVVEDIRLHCPQFDYLIVNDGSTDRTLEICMEHGFHVMNLPVNLGLAGAFQAGMRYAFRKGYQYAVQFDGDGQHLAEYVPAMLDCARQNRYDIVIGSRYIQGEKGFSLREIGSRLIGFCILITTGKRIKDPTSGMRMYSVSVMKKLAMQMNYDPEPDTVAALLRGGASCGEVPVRMNERLYGASYLTAANSMKYMFYMCTSILVVHWLR